MSLLCGCETMNDNLQLVPCGEIGIWRHPRYRDPMCEKHKQTFASIFRDGWQRITADPIKGSRTNDLSG